MDTHDLHRQIAEARGYELQTDPHGSGLRAWYLVNRDAGGFRDSEGRLLVLITEAHLPDYVRAWRQAQGEE